ncbi:MAG: response regulator [Nannocystaceae bacterium]
MPTKILAIDDSKTMRLAIKITFAAEDCEVIAVSKGSEAVARAKKMGADVLLVDANLAAGEPSGYDVCKAMKADSATSHIPVLILVSNQTGPDQSKLSASGAAGHVAKPFNSQELIDQVRGLVGGKPAAKAVTKRPAAKPSVRPAAKPSTRRPTPVPTRKPAPRPAPTASASGSSGKIPIAIPIPFTSAGAPTPGILKRLKAAGGASGVDPQALNALAALSRDVIEQVVWEVVPDLAEQIIKQQQAR